MNDLPRIAILGDFNPNYPTHHILNKSARDVQIFLNTKIQFNWIATDFFNSEIIFEKQNYLGLWIAPGSPYRDFENVISTIKYVRENSIPTLGNCGGFQHMIIEFAKNVCGICDADHEETNPNSESLVIKKLNCSLVGEEENLSIIEKKSLLFEIYGKENFLGKYFCNFGLNEKYIDILEQNGLFFTSKSDDGQVRSFELDNHSFFIGSLFQPALISNENEPNPIIVEFVKKCLKPYKE